MAFTQDLLKRMKKAITPQKTLSWEEKNFILKEYPDNTVNSLNKITQVQVGNDECVSCYKGNSFTGLLRTGTHDLSDNIAEQTKVMRQMSTVLSENQMKIDGIYKKVTQK